MIKSSRIKISAVAISQAAISDRSFVLFLTQNGTIDERTMKKRKDADSEVSKKEIEENRKTKRQKDNKHGGTVGINERKSGRKK